MTTERELLSVMETLNKLSTILLGNHLAVFMYHKNLTHGDFTTEKVLLCRLLLEKYNPATGYIKGPDNDAADAMIRLTVNSTRVLDDFIRCNNIECSNHALVEVVYGKHENDWILVTRSRNSK